MRRSTRRWRGLDLAGACVVVLVVRHLLVTSSAPSLGVDSATRRKLRALVARQDAVLSGLMDEMMIRGADELRAPPPAWPSAAEVSAVPRGVEASRPAAPTRPRDDDDHRGEGRVVEEAQRRPVSSSSSSDVLGVTALVILTHDRVESMSACLAACLALPEAHRLRRVAVSADAAFEAVEAAAAGRAVVWRQPPPRGTPQNDALAKISAHVSSALDRAFSEDEGLELAIVLEDDLRVASDFLRLFELGGPTLLADDQETWCVSAWNDNAGDAEAGWLPGAWRRTTYFPGLGWMISRRAWLTELGPAMAASRPHTTGWDHFVRAASPLRSRDCVYPEVPRVRHVPTARSTNVKSEQAARLARFAFWDGPGGQDSPLKSGPPSRAMDDAFLSEAFGNGTKWTVVPVDVPEQLEDLARRFNTWPSDFRGHSRGAVIVRTTRGKTGSASSPSSSNNNNNRPPPPPPPRGVILADRRTCDLLPPDRRRRLPPSATLVAATANGRSCDAVCAANEPPSRCQDDLLPFADDCDALKARFACEHGCGHQLGSELPAYVVDPRQPTHRQCLLANKAASPRATCAASHKSTRRLCVCLPL